VSVGKECDGDVCVCVRKVEWSGVWQVAGMQGECICEASQLECNHNPTRGRVLEAAKFQNVWWWSKEGSKSLLQPPVDASQHPKLQCVLICSCTTAQITGLTTGKVSVWPTDPTQEVTVETTWE